MFTLLLIFGQRWGKPSYGKNPGLLEGLPTGLRDVALTGSRFLSVPGTVAAQRHTRATIPVGEEPPRACRGQAQTHGMGPDEALPLAALVWPQPGAGVAVTDGNGHGPAGAIRPDASFRGQGEGSGATGVGSRRGFAVARRLGSGGPRTAQHHDPHEVPGPHRGPQAMPGLALGTRCAGVRHPPRGSLCQRRGRAKQGALFAWGTATPGGRGGRHLVALGADGEAPPDMAGFGPPTARVRGRIATSRQALDGASGHLRGQAIEDVPGPLPAGARGHVAREGVRCFARACEADRSMEAMARPTRERDVHDAQAAGQTPPRPVCLAGGARAMARAGAPFDLGARFFLGRIVAAEPHDVAWRDTRHGQTDHRSPEVPALLGEGTPKQPRET